MSIGVAIPVGALTGLALGLVISLTTTSRLQSRPGWRSVGWLALAPGRRVAMFAWFGRQPRC